MFYSTTYPADGTIPKSATVTEEVSEKLTALIITSAILTVLFAVLAIVFWIKHKKDSGEYDAVDAEIRRSIVDLETNGNDTNGGKALNATESLDPTM